jgi:hypothetical protein
MCTKQVFTLILLSVASASSLTGCAADTGTEAMDGDSTVLDKRDPMEVIGQSQAIVNGYDVEGQSTAQGYVRLWGLFADNVWKPYCSGTLITGNVLITAAHCMKGNDITPPFGVNQIIAQVGDQLLWVSGITELTQNLDQTLLQTDGSFGNYKRTLLALDGDASAGAQVKCVGRGAEMPDGSIERYGNQTYTVLTVNNATDITTWPRAWMASYNNSDQYVTHGDSGGGCFLIQGGPESSWPLVGVMRASIGPNINATTFHP